MTYGEATRSRNVALPLPVYSMEETTRLQHKLLLNTADGLIDLLWKAVRKTLLFQQHFKYIYIYIFFQCGAWKTQRTVSYLYGKKRCLKFTPRVQTIFSNVIAKLNRNFQCLDFCVIPLMSCFLQLLVFVSNWLFFVAAPLHHQIRCRRQLNRCAQGLDSKKTISTMKFWLPQYINVMSVSEICYVT